MKWWTEARFGLFIHWGLYALPARHEWVRSREMITLDGFSGRVAYAQLLHDGSEVPIAEKGAETGFLPGKRTWEPSDTVTLMLPVGKPGTEIPVIEIFLE